MIRLWATFVVVVLALTIPGAASAPQLNALAGAPPGPRTGLIVGQVVDSTGAPVPEAVVLLAMPKYFPDLPTTPKGRVMADGDGRFFFADLPAGEYYLRASKEGYGGGTYGLRRPSGEYQLFSLAEGERSTGAKLTLWKYAVISGTVVDEAGEPVVGISVQALLKDVVAGRVRYGPVMLAPYLTPTATTDDRGMFRLSQLESGRYVVAVSSTQTTMPVELLGAQDPALRSELRFASTEVAQLGHPRTQQVGNVAMVTLNRVLIPPPASATGRMEVYRTTYFPAATTAAAATQIALEGGQERTDVTISLRPVTAVRVSGRLVTPDGSAPPPMALRLVGDAGIDVGDEGFEAVTGMSDANGRFTLLGVPAGEYVLKHAGRISALAAQQGRSTFSLSQHVSVGTSDLSDLTAVLRRPLRVGGRIEFRRASSPEPIPPAFPYALVVFETAFGEPGQFAVEAMTSGGAVPFSTIAAAGQYIVRPHERPGWFARSVTVNGNDITDRIFDLQTDTTTLVVVFTDQPSKVSGTVRDGRGAPRPTATVLAFPTDPRRWSGFGSNSRILTSAPASRTGAYTFAHLPAGDYHLVAIDGAETDGWQDPKKLEALAREATKLTVVEAQRSTVDLTVKVIR